MKPPVIKGRNRSKHIISSTLCEATTSTVCEFVSNLLCKAFVPNSVMNVSRGLDARCRFLATNEYNKSEKLYQK